MRIRHRLVGNPRCQRIASPHGRPIMLGRELSAGVQQMDKDEVGRGSVAHVSLSFPVQRDIDGATGRQLASRLISQQCEWGSRS